jgi:zinc transporter ZupT
MAAVMDRFIPHRHARGHRQHIFDDDHEHHDHGHEPRPHRARAAHEDLRRTYLIIGALSIHRVPEGLAIGAGFVASESHAWA